MKKIVSCLLALVCSSAFALEMPYFSGYTGIIGNVSGDITEKGSFTPDLTSEAFFSGQLDYSGKLIFRGEFYLKTQNLLEKSIFLEPEDPNAFFRIQEISATYKHRLAGATNYFSLFLGDFEPIGSDAFLQRQFGIQPISSGLTESWHGVNGSSIYPFYGAGFSYSLHFVKPIVITADVYTDVTESVSNSTSYSTETDNVINTDVRFTCVYPYITFDAMLGAGFPIQNNTETGTAVVAVIRAVDLHGGFNMLIGNRYTTSVFLQAGLSKFEINPSEGITQLYACNIYLIAEPRFSFRTFNLNVTLLNIPADSLYDLMYLKDFDASLGITGINVNVVTDKLFIGNTNFTFGTHMTFALVDPDFETYAAEIMEYSGSPLVLLGEMKSWGMGFFVTPYMAIPVFGGSLSTSLRISAFGFVDGNPFDAVKASIGFKTQI